MSSLREVKGEEWLPNSKLTEFGYFPHFPWSPERHNCFPAKMRRSIRVLFLMIQKGCDGQPRHPECFLAGLPALVITNIIQYLTASALIYDFENDPDLGFATETKRFFNMKVFNIPRISSSLKNAAIFEFGLGSTESKPGTISLSGVKLGSVYLCFHPGTWNGLFRGPAGISEESMQHWKGTGYIHMGFTPEKNRLHHWRVVICRDGRCTVTVKDADNQSNIFVHKWSGLKPTHLSHQTLNAVESLSNDSETWHPLRTGGRMGRRKKLLGRKATGLVPSPMEVYRKGSGDSSASEEEGCANSSPASQPGLPPKNSFGEDHLSLFEGSEIRLAAGGCAEVIIANVKAMLL